MTEDSRAPSDNGEAEKRRVMQARRLISDLAARAGAGEQARRMEADLNDAWLRLQLAHVMDDPALARQQRQAYESLLDEALAKASSEPGPEGA